VEDESPTKPPSAEEMSEVKEESVASSEVTGGVQGALRNAAATVSDALSGASTAGYDRGRPAQGENKTVYIGNLSLDVRDADLEAEFSKYGSIIATRCAIDNQTGQQRGFGFVEFSSVEEANRAIEGAHEQQLLGRRMNVQMHTPKERTPRNRGEFGSRRVPREGPASSKTLFIGNMSYQMSDKDLNDLFREVSNVRDIRVAIDRRSGQPRGFAHADFFDEESAAAAKRILEQKTVYGRNLRVDFTENTTNRRNDRD